MSVFLRGLAFVFLLPAAVVVDLVKTLSPLMFWGMVVIVRGLLGLVSVVLGVGVEATKLCIFTAMWWVPLLAIAVLYANYGVQVIAGVAGLVGVGMIAGALSQTQILNIMLGLLKSAGIAPIKTYTLQLPNDLKSIGVVVMFFSPDRETFLRLRDAANIAGLWFRSANWLDNMALGRLYSVFVVNKG